MYVLKNFYKKGSANYLTNAVTYKAYGLKASLSKILDLAIPTFRGNIKSAFLFGDDLDNETLAERLNESLISGAIPTSTALKYLIDIMDFRKPNAYQNTSISNTTWKKAIEYICKKFNCRWYIDSNGDIRIEHVTYFNLKDSDVTLDNTTHKYSYVSNDMPNREWYEENSTYTQDFTKKEILYGQVPAINGAKESTNTVTLSNFFTDIDGMNQHLNELPSEGFLMVEVSGTSVLKSTGFISGVPSLQNVSLSLGNCLSTFYLYESFKENYTIDKKDVTAKTLKWDKKHEIEFLNDDIPDTSKGITTWLGKGRIINLKYQLVKEGKFKAEMRYE
jgi:hypothetical protein